jgi:hypothetical protein
LYETGQNFSESDTEEKAGKPTAADARGGRGIEAILKPPNVDEGIVEDVDEDREEPTASPSSDPGFPVRLPAPSEDGAATHDRDISDDENLILPGETTVPITSSISEFWLKLLMLPIFDYLSLSLLPIFIHHPIPALLVIHVLYAFEFRLAHL